MRYVKISLVILALPWLISNSVHAVTEEQRQSLIGQPGVFLVIEDISREAVADGLSSSAVQTDVELILRSNGIKILTREEWVLTRNAPMLSIYVQTLRDDSGIYAYASAVSFSQRVSLVPSTRRKEIFATTWHVSQLGTVGKLNLRMVRGSVEDMAKLFANDFLAVNPR